MNINDYVSVVSRLSVIMSKFEVTRPYNFHKVLKTSVLNIRPVPDKTVTTAAQVLFDHVFPKFGFPAVLQSDRGGEFLSAVLHRITKLLSIKHMFTSSYRPRLNRATERVHRWLNAAIGIFL